MHLQESPKAGFFAVFRSKRMVVLLLLGFSSGLPLLLTGQTLQAWMAQAGVDLAGIADLSAVGLAYTFKFAWAPVFDRFRVPMLGRRRGWCLVFQLALIAAIAGMGAVDPVAQPVLLAAVAIVVAFLAASQDIIIDAYKADVLALDERAAGASAYVIGYRLALVVTGTLALIMADHMPWRVIYAVMAAAMVVGLVGTFVADEPAECGTPPRTFASAVVQPFVEFVHRSGGGRTALMLAFAALYRFGDYFVQVLNVTFFTKVAGFSLSEVGVVNKLLGFAGTLVGGLVAGGLVARFGLRRMLIAFGVLAGVTNLLYAWLAVAGHDMVVFCIAVGVDHVSTALGTAAFVAVLMAVCSPAFSATQFALLTSLASVGQRVFGFLGDDVVAWFGWSGYFIATAAMALPGLVLAWWVGRDVQADV